MVTSIDRYDEVDVFVGLDVGKGEHHAVALDRTGKRLFDRALPNDERRLRGVLDQLKAHGTILLVVDQPATIGALPVAVAQAGGALVGYLPGLAMRRIADLHPQPRLAFLVTFTRGFQPLAHFFRQKLNHGSLDLSPR